MKTKLHIDDFKKYSFLSELHTAPNGEATVFVETTVNEDDGYSSHFHLIYGENVRQISTKGKEKSFMWLDNQHILFSGVRNHKDKKRKENKEIFTSFYTQNVYTGQEKKAFELPLDVKKFELIDEGHLLIGAEIDLLYPTLDGKTETEKEKLLKAWKSEDYQIIDEVPFWSNGKGFINKLRTKLFIYNIKTDELTDITSDNQAVYGMAASAAKIAYLTKEIEPVTDLVHTLHVYDIKTKETTVISDKKRIFGELHFHNNDLIVMCKEEDQTFFFDHHIAKVDLATKEITNLTPTYKRTITGSIGSDCKYGSGRQFKVSDNAVYFTSIDGFVAEIMKLDLETKEITKISNLSGSVDAFDIYGEEILAIAMIGDHLQEVYEINSNNKQLTHFNDDIYKHKHHSTPIHHKFTDSEGVEFDGWALLPVGYDEKKKYPTILDIHGGPRSIYGNIYFHEMQYWVNEGYMVIFCNPRGSDGKGDKFADIRGKYGSIDYDNLMQFVDEMIVLYPAIDADKLGVTGGSYGGFMTNWVVGHTTRFKAAASQRSISNWVSKAYTTDIGYYFNAEQMQANAWDNVEKMWHHSPLKYVNKAKTPLLLIHSDNDFRCWTPEAIQMFTAMKLHGNDSRICLFHGENHELSRSGKPNNRVKRLEEITNWMDTYLTT